MNAAVLGYMVAELCVFVYVAILFFKMGQNREPMYMRIREKFASRISLFKKDRVYYVAACLMVVMIVIRIAEDIEKISGGV